MLSRVVSPAGFGLVVLLFLLPFVGVSCSAENLGAMEAEFSGFDLVVGGDPSFETTSPIADMAASGQGELPRAGVAVPAVFVLVLLVAGMGSALVGRPRGRALAGAAAAVLAAVSLALTQVFAESKLVEDIIANSSVLEQASGFDLGSVANEDYLADAVSSRIGFWFCLGLLVLIAAGNLLALARSRAPSP